MKHIKINEWCNIIIKIIKLEFEEDDLIGCEEQIIESLEETLYYACGEASGQWRMTTDQETELGKIISKVVIDYINEKDLQPYCYSVESVEQVKGR